MSERMWDRAIQAVISCACVIVTFAGVLVSSAARAAEVPQTFTLDGQLYGNAAGTSALVDANITFKVQILDEDKTCILYEESQTVSTSATKGYFSVMVGSAVGSTKRSANDSGNSMAAIYTNRANITGKKVSDGTACTVTATDGKRRYVRTIISPSTLGGSPRTLTPDLNLDSVPNAVVAERAETLEGSRAADFLKVNSTAPNVLTQTNLENLFSSSSRFGALTGLIDGTSTQYVRSNAVSGAPIPNLSGAPSTPTNGSIWYDTTLNQLRAQVNGAPIALGVTGAGTGTVTSVSLTAPTEVTVTGSGITTSGTIALSWANQTANKVFASPDGSTGTPAFRSLVAADIPNIAWSKITSGTPTTLAGYGITDAVTNAGGTPSIMQGLDAGKPASGTAGRIYIAYDTGRIYRDGGAAWDIVASASQWTTSSGDIMRTSGNVGIGNITPSVKLDIDGALAMRNMAAPATSAAGTGRIYFDTTANKFKVSENNGAYVDLVGGGGGGGTVSGTTGTLAKFTGASAVGDSIVSESGSVLTVAGTIAGSSAMSLSAGGSNQNLTLSSTGTGSVNTTTGNGTQFSVINGPASTVNYLTATGAATTGVPTLSTAGADTNITMSVAPKGTGSFLMTGLGNVGVGFNLTGFPGTKFDVMGNIRTSGSWATIDNGFPINSGRVEFHSRYDSNAASGPITTSFNRMSFMSVVSDAAGTARIGVFDNADAEVMSLMSTGSLGLGVTLPNTKLDVNGAVSVRGMAAPAASVAGQGRIYFDSTANKFKVSENNGAYVDLVGGGGSGTITSGTANKLVKYFSGTTVMESAITENGGKVAIGDNAVASGTYSFAAGYDPTASGNYSTALGRTTVASGHYATAMGQTTTASGQYSTAMGRAGTAAGLYSTSMGYTTTATGDLSTSMGGNTTADAYAQVTMGRYNLPLGTENATTWVTTDPLFVIGNGTNSGASRSNAMMVLKSGDVGIGTNAPGAKLEVAGQVKITGGTPGAGKVLTSDAAGLASWTNFSVGNLLTSGGAAQFANASCTAAQTLTWSSLTGTFTCSNIDGLDADKIDSGTIATARLGSGTADNTTYLRGDGTWATPSGGAAANTKVTYLARATTTANSTLTGTPTIDGVSLVAGDRVVVRFQTTPSQNGVYVVAAGAWTRATDLDTWAEAIGYEVLITEGSNFNGMRFKSTAVIGGTLGTTNLEFSAEGAGGDAQANTALGVSSLRNGYSNTAIGGYTLYATTSGYNNTAVGMSALMSTTSGYGNTAVGQASMTANTNGNRNTALGFYTMPVNTTGQMNTAVGGRALSANTTAGYNVAVGFNALQSNVAKEGSTAIGYGAMLRADNSATTANAFNTALGYQALIGSATTADNTGINNTAIGKNALGGMSSGSSNIGLGADSGSAITTGSNNVVIGSNTGSGIATSSNNILFSDGAGTQRLLIDSTGNMTTAGPFTMSAIAAPGTSGAGYGRIYFDSTANKFKVSENNGAYVDLVGSGGGFSSSGGTISGAVTISSGGLSNTGGLNNNSGGITNAGSITGVGTNLTGSGALTVAAGGTNQNLTLSPSGTGIVQVNGTLVGKAATSNTAGPIDFNSSNLQYTTNNCGTFALHNMKDGGTYSFAVQGTTSATCVFTAYSDAGSTALTFHYPPDHGSTVDTKHTVYTFIVMGTHVYASWVTGI